MSVGIPSAMTTALDDEDDESLAQFLESEVLAHVSDQVRPSLFSLLPLPNFFISSSLNEGIFCRKMK